MVNKAFSIEELIGIESYSSKNKANSTSLKNSDSYCGFDDGVYADVTQAAENLRFIDTYSKINQKNVADKIHMLKKIHNIYANNIYDKEASSSIESYCLKQLFSTEDNAAQAGNNGAITQQSGSTGNAQADKMQENAGKTKGGFFKKIIETIKQFIQKVVDFIKLIINKVKTFFGRFLADVSGCELVKKNPFSKDETWLDFSSYNLANAKAFIKPFERINARIDENATSGRSLDGSVENFMKQMKSKVQILSNIDEGDEKNIDAAVAWNMFGMKMCNGEEAFRKADLRKVVQLAKTMNNESGRLYEDLIKINNSVNETFKPLQEIANGLQSGQIKDTKEGFQKANEAATQAAKDKLKQENGAIVGTIKGLFVKVDVSGLVVMIKNSKDMKEICNFLKKLITVTNKTAAIGQKIGTQISKLIVKKESKD